MTSLMIEDSPQAGSTEISFDQIDQLRADFSGDIRAKMAQNAVTQTTVDDIALNREIVTKAEFSFSTKLNSSTHPD